MYGPLRRKILPGCYLLLFTYFSSNFYGNLLYIIGIIKFSLAASNFPKKSLGCCRAFTSPSSLVFSFSRTFELTNTPGGILPTSANRTVIRHFTTSRIILMFCLIFFLLLLLLIFPSSGYASPLPHLLL